MWVRPPPVIQINIMITSITSKLEIERRFLLIDAPKNTFNERLLICQWFKETNEGIFRFRKVTNFTNQELWFEKIKKVQIEPGVNEETIFEIDRNNFLPYSEEIPLQIKKHRYIYHRNGLKFEIDVFQDIKLVILEVELNDKNDEIIFPDFIQELIIKEITDQREFSNYNLAKILNKQGTTGF